MFFRFFALHVSVLSLALLRVVMGYLMNDETLMEVSEVCMFVPTPSKTIRYR